MRLIRGWEKQFAPSALGGFRLSQATVYPKIGEEDGLGDIWEGEVRLPFRGKATTQWETSQEVAENPDEWKLVSVEMGGHKVDAEDEAEFSGDLVQEATRRHFAEMTDDPNVGVTPQGR